MASLFEAQQWTDAVNKLKSSAADFVSLLARVNDTGPLVIDNPELRAERARLIERAGIVRGTIEKVTQGIDYVHSVWDQVFGDNAVNGLSNLGIIPLVPVVVIAGAGAGITYWITDAVKFLKRVDEVEALKSEGMTAREAYAIVDREKGVIGFLRSVSPLIAVGALAWFISKRVRK